MKPEEAKIIESVLHATAVAVKEHPWKPCHNDFHSHNVMIQHATKTSTERLLAIDFEDCDLGDPMWDLAYLTVNLEMEQRPYSLAVLYGADNAEIQRIRAYVPLAIAHCATWTAMRGGPWAQHSSELMQKLKEYSDLGPMY